MKTYGNSRCGRCLAAIPPEALEAFLASDYLCPDCSEQPSDSTHAQILISTERRGGPQHDLPPLH